RTIRNKCANRSAREPGGRIEHVGRTLGEVLRTGAPEPPDDQYHEGEATRVDDPVHYLASFCWSFSLRGVNSRSRLALLTTVTELNDMAAPAMIGLSSQPVNGNSTPAAIGTPRVL